MLVKEQRIDSLLIYVIKVNQRKLRELPKFEKMDTNPKLMCSDMDYRILKLLWWRRL